MGHNLVMIPRKIGSEGSINAHHLRKISQTENDMILNKGNCASMPSPSIAEMVLCKELKHQQLDMKEVTDYKQLP